MEKTPHQCYNKIKKPSAYRVKELKKRVLDCLSKKKSNYQKSGKQHGIINLERKVAPDVICAVADDMILLASNSLAQLYLVEIILGTVKDFVPYPKKCKLMLDMCICGSYVILSHSSGIAKINFEFRQETTVLSNNTKACKEECGVATLEQTTIVFTDMGSRQVKS